jgi:hypothetical protein
MDYPRFHSIGTTKLLIEEWKKRPLFHVLDIKSRKRCPYFVKSSAIQPPLTAFKNYMEEWKKIAISSTFLIAERAPFKLQS